MEAPARGTMARITQVTLASENGQARDQPGPVGKKLCVVEQAWGAQYRLHLLRPTQDQRAPKISEPMRTWVAPKAMAFSKSALMPALSC